MDLPRPARRPSPMNFRLAACPEKRPAPSGPARIDRSGPRESVSSCARAPGAAFRRIPPAAGQTKSPSASPPAGNCCMLRLLANRSPARLAAFASWPARRPAKRRRDGTVPAPGDDRRAGGNEPHGTWPARVPLRRAGACSGRRPRERKEARAGHRAREFVGRQPAAGGTRRPRRIDRRFRTPRRNENEGCAAMEADAKMTPLSP